MPSDAPLKLNGLPCWPTPFSPVHRARKFSAVLGTTELVGLSVSAHYTGGKDWLCGIIGTIVELRGRSVSYQLSKPPSENTARLTNSRATRPVCCLPMLMSKKTRGRPRSRPVSHGLPRYLEAEPRIHAGKSDSRDSAMVGRSEVENEEAGES